MRVRADGNVGIGTTAPASQFEVSATSAGANVFVARLRNSGTTAGTQVSLLLSTNNATAGGAASSSISSVAEATVGNSSFVIGTPSGSNPPAERMRITSAGNVGIGTTSPTFRLDVQNSAGAGSARIKGGTSANQSAAFYVTQAGSTSTLTAYGDRANIFGGTVDQSVSIFTGSGIPLLFDVGGTTKATLDSSGNLGLGVTPSAWGSTWKAIQVGMGGSIFARTADQNRIGITANAFFDTAFKYIGTGQATLYDQDDGNHFWYTSASGTAGNAISFTQAMTLDAAGELGIGVTSPSARLDLASGTGAAVTAVLIRAVSGNANGFQIVTDSVADTVFLNNFYNAALRFGTNNTERARIDTSGNLLVGLTSATGVAKLQVSGAIRTTGFTVATLPAGTVGMRTYVTDALAPAFGVAVAGSGAVTIPVFYDGAN
jgi:hypothetical protein